MRYMPLMALLAVLALTACAQPARASASQMDDTRGDTHRPDRGMRDSHMM